MHYLLHAKNFGRIPCTGRLIQRRLQARAAAVARVTVGSADPSLSIVIRTRNDSAYIKQLFEDIDAQIFDGQVEVILVDTASTDDTTAYASSRGAKIIRLSQEEFTYPRALNLGFRATHHPWVVTLVGHSSLSNRMMFKSLTHWCQDNAVSGVYGIPLANWNGSFGDRLGSAFCLFVSKKPRAATGPRPGMLGANCSIVKREVWEQLGGYDERYGAGGEDTALARSMLSNGFSIVREPLCSVFHSHGLHFRNSVKQWLHWLKVSKARPQSFSAAKVHARRPDLR